MARSAAESLTRLKSLDAVKQRRAATVLGALLADAASECEGGSSCFCVESNGRALAEIYLFQYTNLQ